MPRKWPAVPVLMALVAIGSIVSACGSSGGDAASSGNPASAAPVSDTPATLGA
jgi:hypothetical protein